MTLALVAVVVPIGALVAVPADDSRTGPGPTTRPAVADVLDRIPLGFEANQGQYEPEIRFAARAPGHTVLLTEAGLAISTPGSGGSTVAIRLDGARREPEITGGQPLAARSNQLLGDDQSRWRTDVKTFGTVSYREVYPGIDVVFYGRGRYVEHDFVVAPGADPGAIRLALSGASGSHLDGNGDLVLPVGTDEVRLRAPELYQDVNGRRQRVDGRFELRPDGTVGFDVGSYDRAWPLIIDPVVVSASYLGGTSTETAYGVAVDVDGNIVVAGYTESSDFPTVSPAQANLVQSEGARTDVFVTKVKADGTTVLWSTYLGGRNREAALAVAVGGDGGVYLTGYTESSDFPTNRPIQSANAGGANDGFVAKLNSAGSALEYSTYLGGKGAETGAGIAVDPSGAAYVVGHTGSPDFPTANPFLGSLARPDDLDGFVAKIQPGGGALAYSSYIGGGGDDHLTDVAVDSEGSAHVVGDTRAGDFPTVRGFQGALGGAAGGGNFADGVVAKVRPDGSGLVYASFIGGTDSDKATAVAVDGQGNAYVSGNTGSANFPVISAFQPKKDGDFDAFVTKLKADGNLAYSSFLGGSGSDGGEAVAVDRQGRAFVSGATASTNFPTEKAFQGAKAGGFVDAFITQVSINGQSLVSSSYLGGRDDDQAAGVAVDGEGNLAVVGYTNSADFPIAKPFQAQKAGGVGDAFVVKVRDDATAGSSDGTPALSKRERRVRTLVTLTGGLLIAAALQTLWLRRKQGPTEQPEPAPTGQEVEVPGLRYVPRRGRPAPGPTRTGGFARSEPVKSADWDRRHPVGLARPEEDLDEDETVLPKRHKPAPAWDEPQRPVLRSLERQADGAGAPEVPVPDLWGSDAPLAEAAASVRAGRSPGDRDVDEALDDDSDPDDWPTHSAGRRRPVAELDPLDVWGPLVAEQDPDQWVEDWGFSGLLKPEERPAERAGLTAVGQGAARAEREAARAAEREAAKAAEVATQAERAALEAAVEEAAARKAAELAEREAAELAAQDAADVWGPDLPERVDARATEAAAAEGAKGPDGAVAAGPTEGAEVAGRAEAEAAEQRAAVERAAAERAEREARERAEAAAAEQRAAAERAALHAAVRQAAEREAMAMRTAPDGTGAQPALRQPPGASLERDAAEKAAIQAAELEGIAQSRAEAARAAQAARLTAQAEAAEATRVAQAAQAEARAAAQAAALQAALAAFEAAEAEAARMAEADAARLAAQVASQVAEAHAARIAAQAAAAAQAESEARARAEAQLEAERQAAAAADAAARAQAEADVRAAAAATAAAEAELRSEVAASPSEAPPGTRQAAWSEAVADAEAWAEEARLAEAQAAEASAIAQAAERAEREAAEAAERAEREAAEARAAEARAAERQARQLRSPEERAAEREAAAARAAEARAAEARAAEARAAQARAAEARAGEARAAEARAAEARAAEARANQARAAQAEVNEGRAEDVRAAQSASTPAGPLADGGTRRPAPPQQPPQRESPSQPGPGARPDLSLSELLDEDLPIPEPVGGQQRPHWDQRRLDQVLDEDFPVPESQSRPPQPVAPPPNPSGLVGGTTGPAGQDEDEEEADDFLPPPPQRLLANLFEPDPDDPLVQSTRSRRGRRHKDP